MSRAVTADRVEAIAEQPMDVRLDPVTDRAYVLDRPASRVRDIPRLHHRWHIWAGIAAAHCDRPIGVQLYLQGELLGLASGEIEADLAHGLHDLRPNRSGGFGA